MIEILCCNSSKTDLLLLVFHYLRTYQSYFDDYFNDQKHHNTRSLRKIN